MTPYEFAHLAATPFLPALIGTVRRELRRCCASGRAHPLLLDVGGRKSPYTIGLPARVTVSDIPREGAIRTSLGLGFTSAILDQLRRLRSNISDCVIDDMVNSALPPESFDIVCCVEVIEHIPEDHQFVSQVHRILKPGGYLVLTTPNGDYVRNEPPNFNPDHVRHYTRAELVTILSSQFGSTGVKVRYAVKTGVFRAKGLRSFSPKRPFRAIENMACNVISHLESQTPDEEPRRRAHLIATVRKQLRTPNV